jgi:type I restriction-modification system DNA methylase subunit
LRKLVFLLLCFLTLFMLDDIKKPLCATAVQLRANMDAAEYTHLVLSLILLKYVSDTFTRNQHSDPRADFVLANPPLNISDWRQGRLKGDPPLGDANYAWLRHMRHHLKPSGRACIVLANGSMSSSRNNEVESRAAMVGAYVGR